jgi:hypothetical protein
MVTEGSFEVVKMIINLDLEDYIDCEDVTIVADCYIEESTDLICVDTGYEEKTLEIEIEGLFVDGVFFSQENLATVYGQSVADKIVNHIEYKAGNVYYS